MSFDMSYDKNNTPKVDPSTKEQYDQPTPVEDIPQESSDLAESIEQLNVEQSDEPQPSVSNTKDPVAHNESYNFKTLREKALRIEKERDDAILRLQKYEQMQQDVKNNTVYDQPVVDESEEEINFSDDDLVEGKHLNKALKSMNAKLKKQSVMIKQQQAQAVELATEARIKAQYNDFDAVVNQENLKLLSIMHPEIASTIYNSNGDLYSKSVSAYSVIKNMGIYQQADEFVHNKEAIQKNSAKPRPLTSISPQQGESPLSRVNAFSGGLTDELKKQLHKEMMHSIKNA